MSGRVTGIFICSFWLIMMGLLVRQDLLPGWLDPQTPSYQTLLARRLQAERYSMSVWFGSNRIGRTESSLEPKDDGSYGLENQTVLDGAVPGLGEIRLHGYTQVGEDYRLKKFDSTLRAGGVVAHLNGHVEGDRLRIVFATGGENQIEHEVPYRGAGTFSNGLSPFVQMPDLTVGKEWTICALNPLTGQAETGAARVEQIDELDWEGKTVEAFRVVLDQGRQQATCWIDRRGRILREEVPFMTSKLVMIREAGE